MIARRALKTVQDALNRQAAVALLGPRQVGKTTLALAIAEPSKALYLDLEAREDRDKLSDPVSAGVEAIGVRELAEILAAR